MSLKVKLFSTIAAFILVLGIMFGAVLAAEQVQVNIGGTVSFTATSVNAKITGSVSGSNTSNTLPETTIDADTTDGALSMGGDWSNMHLDFKETGEDITVTINIQNLSTRTIYVNMTDSTSISNVNITRKAGSSTISATDANRQITGNQTLTYTFTLSLASKDVSVSNGSFDLDIDLASILQTYTATITNNTDSTFYVQADGGQVYTLTNGNEQRITANVLSFADSQSAFENANTFEVGELDDPIQAKAPGSSGCNIYIDSVVGALYSEFTWFGDGYSDLPEGSYYLSNNSTVFNYILSDNCTITIDDNI